MMRSIQIIQKHLSSRNNYPLKIQYFHTFNGNLNVIKLDILEHIRNQIDA